MVLKWIFLFFLPTLDINVDALFLVIVPAGVCAAVAPIHRFNEQVGHPTVPVVIRFNAQLQREKQNPHDYSGSDSGFGNVACVVLVRHLLGIRLAC